MYILKLTVEELNALDKLINKALGEGLYPECSKEFESISDKIIDT